MDAFDLTAISGLYSVGAFELAVLYSMAAFKLALCCTPWPLSNWLTALHAAFELMGGEEVLFAVMSANVVNVANVPMSLLARVERSG